MSAPRAFDNSDYLGWEKIFFVKHIFFVDIEIMDDLLLVRSRRNKNVCSRLDSHEREKGNHKDRPSRFLSSLEELCHSFGFN